MIKKIYLKTFLLFKKYYYQTLIIIVCLTLFGLIKYTNIGEIINNLELWLYDFRTKIYINVAANDPDDEIIILVHNDESNRIIDQYPELNLHKWAFPRDEWKYVLRFLKRAENKLTVYDVVFTGKSEKEYQDKVLIDQIKSSGNVILALIVQGNAYKNFVLSFPKFKCDSVEKVNYLLSYYFNNKTIKKTSYSPLFKYYEKSFVDIPLEKYKQLGADIISCIVFTHAQGNNEDILKAPLAFGVINISSGEADTEVTRLNKPLWKYRYTDLFAQALPLISARYVIANPEKNKISFTSDLLGKTLNIGNRKFPLNESGDYYINWRPNITINSYFKNFPYAYTSVPLVKIIISEKYFYLDSQKGYYDITEYPYRRNDSIFNSISESSIPELYEYYLKNHYYVYINIVNQLENLNLSLESDISKYSYFDNLNYIIKSNSSFGLLTWFLINDNFNLIKNESNIKIEIELLKYRNLYVSPYEFFNKIVVVGEATATGDVHTTSVCKAYPGPEIVATALDNYLNDGTSSNKIIRRVPVWFDVLIILFFAIMISYTSLKSRSFFGSIAIFIIIYMFFIIFNISVFIYPLARLWFNAIYPLCLLPVVYFATISYKNIVLDKDKHHIKTLFGKFVSPQILEAVLDNPELLSAGAPRKKEMTVLFSDIRDFTSKSEHVPPEELIPQLNEYFTEMVEVIIMKYNGTLDKYMGDAIMAFWGDPIPMEDHAKNAVLAALSMCKHLELLNEKWEKEGKPPLRIGVGINSGEMIVGHMGSPRLIDYTVLGDNVNVASRVESLNKAYGKEIIITEATYEFVKDIIEVEQLGTTSVKGRTKEVVIYSVEGLKDGVEVNFDRTPKLFVEKEQT